MTRIPFLLVTITVFLVLAGCLDLPGLQDEGRLHHVYLGTYTGTLESDLLESDGPQEVTVTVEQVQEPMRLLEQAVIGVHIQTRNETVSAYLDHSGQPVALVAANSEYAFAKFPALTDGLTFLDTWLPFLPIAASPALQTSQPWLIGDLTVKPHGATWTVKASATIGDIAGPLDYTLEVDPFMPFAMTAKRPDGVPFWSFHTQTSHQTGIWTPSYLPVAPSWPTIPTQGFYNGVPPDGNNAEGFSLERAIEDAKATCAVAPDFPVVILGCTPETRRRLAELDESPVNHARLTLHEYAAEPWINRGSSWAISYQHDEDNKGIVISKPGPEDPSMAGTVAVSATEAYEGFRHLPAAGSAAVTLGDVQALCRDLLPQGQAFDYEFRGDWKPIIFGQIAGIEQQLTAGWGCLEKTGQGGVSVHLLTGQVLGYFTQRSNYNLDPSLTRSGTGIPAGPWCVPCIDPQEPAPFINGL